MKPTHSTLNDKQKVAVILFNLGGPDSLKAVRPFLYNLFSDKAIIRIPGPFRQILAWLISLKRSSTAKEIYQHIGGKSPILELTHKQAEALEKELNTKAGEDKEWKVYTSMRYWKPRAKEVSEAVARFEPNRMILLPLYPQFSTTTTLSSFREWRKYARERKINAETTALCCYPTDKIFTTAHADTIRNAYWKASKEKAPRILFSAHGLPESIIDAGDPYQWQVEQTVNSVVNILQIPDLDYDVCYQSRVGPVKWIGPSTEDEIMRAGKDKKPIIIVPIAFISEHSETLVELDIEYASLAKEHGVPEYVRVPALGTNPYFIEALTNLCQTTLERKGVCSHQGERICPEKFGMCPKKLKEAIV